MAAQTNNNHLASNQDKLIKLCRDYQAHLDWSIQRRAHKMPLHVIRSFKTHWWGSINIEQIISHANKGRSLCVPLDKLNDKPHSSELYPDLHLAIKKYNIVTEMLKALNDGKLNPEEAIEKMKGVLTAENKATLKRRDKFSRGRLFLENIFHILTLGLHSKVYKGTFAFWKAHGQVLSEQIKEQVDSTSSESKTPK